MASESQVDVSKILEPPDRFELSFLPYQSSVLGQLDEDGLEPGPIIEVGYQGYESCALPLELSRQTCI